MMKRDSTDKKKRGHFNKTHTDEEYVASKSQFICI